MIPAIVLAAGLGRRMGGPKALLEVGGETLLQRAVRIAADAGCAPVLAVVGEGVSVPPGAQPICNPAPAEGMASSIRAGIAALPAEAQQALLMVVDQPAVEADLLRALLALAGRRPDRPAACAYAGTVGIPAVFPRRLFPALRALRGDQGAKALLLLEEAPALPFPAGARDLDTPQDLDRFRR